MGSWHGTCGVTQLPIHYGDDVVLIFLEKNEYAKTNGGGFVQSHDQYNPISLPVMGKYDGVGCLKDIYEGNHIVLEQFNTTIINGDDRIPRKVDTNPDKLTPETIKELIKMTERRKFNGIGFMLVHREIYYNLLNEIGNRKTYSYADKDDIVRRRLYTGSIKDSVQTTNDIYHEHSDHYGVKFMINTTLECMHNLYYEFTKGRLSFYANAHITSINRQEILDFWLFCDAMAISRKMWIPQVGAGATYDEHYMPKLIASFILKREQKLHDDYKNNCTDYDDVKDVIGKWY